MAETTAEQAERLKREGRFKAFKKRRADLVSDGKTKKAAWTTASAEFPPLPADQMPVARPTVKAPWPMWNGPVVATTDFRSVIFWVLSRIGRDTRQEDAPGSGAWALLGWANEKPDKFFSIYVRGLLKADLRRRKAERKLRSRPWGRRTRLG